MLKLVPMQTVNWLDRREMPRRSSDFRVTGIVAAVLEVLSVLAITSSAAAQESPGRHPGDHRHLDQVPDHLERKAGDDDQDEPDQGGEHGHALLIAHARRDDSEDCQGHERHHPEQDFHEQLEADLEQVGECFERVFTAFLLAIADFHQADPEREGQEDELGEMVLGERLADAAGDEIQQQIRGRLVRDGCRRCARFDERRAFPRLDEIGQSQPDEHGDGGVHEVKEHHERAQTTFDLVNDDCGQDGKDDQWCREGGEGAENDPGEQFKLLGSLAQKQPYRNGDDHGDQDPDEEGKPSRPALRFILGGRRVLRHIGGSFVGWHRRLRGKNDQIQSLPVRAASGGMTNYAGWLAAMRVGRGWERPARAAGGRQSLELA